MQEENKKMPKVTTAILVKNENNRYLMVRSQKWHGKLVMPGGHVEWGETVEDCIKREAEEELGIDVYDPEFVIMREKIFSEEYVKEKHIISLHYVVKTDAREDGVVLEEGQGEYVWATLEEMKKMSDVHQDIPDDIVLYLKQKKESEKCEEYKSGWQRAVADYQNLQKEVATRRQEWIQMSELQILEEFIPVYDHFKKAMMAMDSTNAPMDVGATNFANTKQFDSIKQGVGFIMKQFAGVLKAHGVEEIKTIGEKFDPKFHEAAGEEEVEGKKHGEIVKEVDGGYVMNGRVVKPAKVIIAK